MFVASIGCFFLLKWMAVKRVSSNSSSKTSLTNVSSSEESSGNTCETDVTIQEWDREEEEKPIYTRKQTLLVIGVAKLLAFVALLLAAVIRPSALSVVYLLVYLTFGTWWAFCKNLGRGFAIACRCVMGYAYLHIVCFMIFQMPWAHEQFPANEVLPRYNEGTKR